MSETAGTTRRTRWHGLVEVEHPAGIRLDDYGYWTREGQQLTCPLCGVVSDRSQGTERINGYHSGDGVINLAWTCAGACTDDWHRRAVPHG